MKWKILLFRLLSLCCMLCFFVKWLNIWNVLITLMKPFQISTLKKENRAHTRIYTMPQHHSLKYPRALHIQIFIFEKQSWKLCRPFLAQWIQCKLQVLFYPTITHSIIVKYLLLLKFSSAIYLNCPRYHIPLSNHIHQIKTKTCFLTVNWFINRF